MRPIILLCLLQLVLRNEIVESNNLDVSDVRLSGGSGPFEGRVEIQVDGVWGTVCDREFSMREAAVICRTMDLLITELLPGAHYGLGTGPVFVQQFNCDGNETDIGQCTYEQNVICTHTDDVGVICSECGNIDVKNVQLSSISADGTLLTITCNEGYSTDKNNSICKNRTWTPPSLRCTGSDFPLNITSMRLADGVGLADGRVEILVNGTWGTLCGLHINRNEADVICRMQGFGDADTYYGTFFYYYYYQGTGPVYLSNLDCSGTESHINQCTYDIDQPCSHYYDIGLVCRHPLNITDIRLVAGTGEYDGRVEVYSNGVWGTICDSYNELNDSQTACKMLNLNFTHQFTTAVYGEGAYPILIGELDCSGDETTLNDCSYNPPSRYNCDHYYDMTLVCTACGKIDDDYSTFESINGSEITVKCKQGYQPDTYKMICLKNGTWSHEQSCSLEFDYPLDIIDIRLEYNYWSHYIPSEGLVELLVNGLWGTICNDNINNVTANVICHMLGLEIAGFYTYNYSYYQNIGPIYIENLNCTGSESHVNECRYDIGSSCTHVDDLAVICTGYQLNITGIRLSGAPGPYQGRVELEVNGTWGTVGDNYFGSYEAQTVCRMLGLEYRSYNYYAYFGEGSGPIYVDWLDCPYSASHINHCRYSVNNFNAQHYEDVSVTCWGPSLNITDIRLVNGTSIRDGRVEIKVNNTWSTICDRNFDIYSANLICNMLGLRAAKYYTGAYYGEGSGLIYIDELHCDGDDQELSSCQYLYLNECTHEMDVSVVCNECGRPDIYFWDIGYFSNRGSILYADCSYYRTYVGSLQLTCDNNTQSWVKEGECQEYSFPLNITGIRLVDGPRTSAGRVEIKSLDTWGTICSDRFGITEANVICNMIGYPHALSFHTSAFYGEGAGPIFVDNLSCADNSSSHINDCSYMTYDDCNHQRDVSVACLECEDVFIANGFVNSSATNYKAAIKIECANSYKLAGDSVIICQLNGSWSKPFPLCSLIDCDDPVPANGFGNTSATINGTVVTIQCEEGYDLVGDNIILCQENETWTDRPTCQIKNCGYPFVLNADVTLRNNKTIFGETVLINCKSGYKMIGSSSITCNSSGLWEDIPTCSIVDCGDPTPVNGFVNKNGTTFGTAVQVTCSPGYNLTGNSTIVCNEDGTWSDNPVCDSTDCGILSVSNGKITYSQETYLESVATLECNAGYSITGSSIATCVNVGLRAAWNASFNCDIQVCADPTPSNGNVINTDATDIYVFQNYAELQCDVGYAIHGDSVITCDDGGVWSDNTKCLFIDCGPLSALINGNINYYQGTNYNAEIQFSCHTGYLLVGAEITKCEESGEWSNVPPKCVAKSDLGGYCINMDYCLLEGSLCVNNICKCSSGIFDSDTNKCDTMPLMPFGAAHGDYVIPKPSICGPKITFQPGFPVKDKLHTDLYVCRFGYISFDQIFQNPTPPKSMNLIRRDRMLLAPFYGPIDLRKSGPVSYRTFDILNSYNLMKENMDIVSDIEMFVKKFGNLDRFSASFILIATWSEIVPFLRGFDMTKTSTFQVILVSDGKVTFTMFTYGNGRMNWEYNFSTAPPVWVGSSLDSVIDTNPYAYTKKALELDTTSSIAISDKEVVSGVVFRSLNALGVGQENSAVDCINWYNENYEYKKDIDYFASLMPECPCDIQLSRFDPWFWKIGLYRWRYDLNYKCVDMLPLGNFGQYGKSCCYDLRSWLLIYERPLAGSFHLYNWQYTSSHFVNDLEPKSKCCSSSKYCNLYYDLRPTGSCYRKSPYKFGAFWGDPHFSTLDGLNFTFNGLGEYTLLKIRSGNCSFDLQARTERALKLNGSLADATIFTAFAAKDLTSSVHIERNKNRTGMNIYGNEIDLTDRYNNNTDEMEPFIWSSKDGNLSISKRNDSVYVYFPSCDISLSISLNIEMLTLRTSVQNNLKNLTQGLLGNYNDDISDDFTMPNGSVLMSNITEKDIFQYGKTWSIDPDDSAFRYDIGKTHYDFHNDSYTPRFLDDIDDKLKEKASETCKDPNDLECIFDFAFTENAKIAEETNIFKVNLNEDKKEMDEIVPFLDGCSQLSVTKGEKSVCNLKVDVNDTIQFVSNNVEVEINQEKSTISIIPLSNDPISLSLEALNKNGRKSPQLVLNFVMCTGCSGHGFCTGSERTDERENQYFRYNSCECHQGYEGIDCEATFDGCAASPCSLDRNCTTLTAEEQQAKNISYICAPCPESYLDDGDEECKDEDECDLNNGGCDQQCINTEGSFECSCYDGYKLSSNDKYNCTDINECEELLHNCSHLCKNTDGGFTCQCFHGYEYNGTSCIQISDGNCSNACDFAHGCTVNDNNVHVCFCNNGYQLDETGGQCLDIDECSQNICPQNCTNTDGSYRCSCFPGYRLEGISTCKECESTFWGNNCEKECICNGRGASHCHPIKGCVCESGWFGDNCDEDINECEFKMNPCDNPRKTCVNTLGTHRCDCRTGFFLTDQGLCSDFDECLEPHLNNCTQECMNTIGSYSCGCKTGFTKIGGFSCEDVNECELGTSDCEQRCVNNEGRYSCYCYYGYTLNDDRRTCSKIEDPCLSVNNLTCSHFCMLMNEENAVCGCQPGYMLEQDNQTCTDVDECNDIEKNDCDDDATCQNTQGSFLCHCPEGKRLENDGRTCTDCDGYHYGQNCAQNCSCLNGICDKKTGCVCEPGWAGITCETDIDECYTGQISCLQQHSACVNVLGQAFCSCNIGYQNISGICQDIDECLDVSLNECDQVCTNTEGSFICSCHSGFIFDTTCTDIDECSGSHNCDQVCENSIGSYSCSCNEGYRLDLNTRKTCISLHECIKEICPNESTCSVQNGDEKCQCLKGYRRVGDQCIDLDECQEFNLCSQNCSNTPGSFICSCNVGFNLLSDKLTCKDVDKCVNGLICPNNFYRMNTFGSFTCNCLEGFFKTGSNECEECDFRHFGDSCLDECQCNFENTEDCHHKTGVCHCKQGWEGEVCSDDIYECKDEDVCRPKANSICNNTKGSYICVCDKGFREENKFCNECQLWKYGYDCSSSCSCNQSNTDSCDSKTGQCMCKNGWNDTNCETDIDECLNETVCPPYSSCNNTEGSYDCICNIGYTKIINETCEVCMEGSYGYNCSSKCDCEQQNIKDCDHINGSCTCLQGWKGVTCNEDIDECEMNTSLCQSKFNSSCHNTNGSYDCSCNEGFREQGDTCTDCDEWKYGKDCHLSCTCNVTTSDYCDATNGTCKCEDGWDGEKCEEDIDECNDSKICPENSKCINSLGSFDCVCIDGFFLDESKTCSECGNNTYGTNCTNTCECISENSASDNQTCDTVTGQCKCGSNWEGDTCNVDINECNNGSIVCSGLENTVCVNTLGSYVCDCKRGFVYSNSGKCMEDEIKPTTKPDLGIWIEASVNIEIDLPVETNLNAASVYTEIQNRLNEMLRVYYRNFTESVFDVIIININGTDSITTHYVITTTTAGKDVILQLAAGLILLGKGTQLLYDGQLVNASSDTFHDQEACQVFSSVGGSCGEEFSCEVDNDIPVCRINSDQEANWKLIIGLSGAGLFLLIVLALFVFSIRQLRRRSEKKKRLSERVLNLGEGSRSFTAESNHTRHNDDSSGFYRNYKWQNGQVVDTGIRQDSLFKFPRYKTHTHLNDTQTFQSPLSNSQTSTEIRRINWM